MNKTLLVSTLFLLLTPALQAQLVEIPFTLNRCAHPVIEVKMGNEVLHLVIDTGATITELDNRFSTRRRRNRPTMIMLTEFDQIEVQLGFRSFSTSNRLCGNVDGVLGHNVLSGAESITLNYRTCTLILNYGENDEEDN